MLCLKMFIFPPFIDIFYRRYTEDNRAVHHYTCAHTIDGDKWYLTDDSCSLKEVSAPYVKQRCVLIFIKECIVD